jgi:hypothetical protein
MPLPIAVVLGRPGLCSNLPRTVLLLAAIGLAAVEVNKFTLGVSS